MRRRTKAPLRQAQNRHALAPPPPHHTQNRRAMGAPGRAIWLIALALACAPLAAKNAPVERPEAKPVLWQNPGDIRSKDLFYGPGGKSGQPALPVKFLNEDLKGTSPKFDVRDSNGRKWRAKLGPESRPETVATRLLWAVGYGANEDYFFETLEVEDLPTQLQRGQQFVSAAPSPHAQKQDPPAIVTSGPGEIKAVRLQIHPAGEKKEGKSWNWRHNPFYGTREFNGLRVMMALINNWDLMDDNNAVYQDPSDPAKALYMVTDVGASFGKTGKSYSEKISKGNLKAYVHSKFISRVTDHHVDFNFPTHPAFIHMIFEPKVLSHYLDERWIGRHIPRKDTRWIGSLLGQLSPHQIREAFRAAGYSPEEIEEYATALEGRIAELKNL